MACVRCVPERHHLTVGAAKQEPQNNEGTEPGQYRGARSDVPPMARFGRTRDVHGDVLDDRRGTPKALELKLGFHPPTIVIRNQ